MLGQTSTWQGDSQGKRPDSPLRELQVCSHPVSMTHFPGPMTGPGSNRPGTMMLQSRKEPYFPPQPIADI